MNEGTFFLFKSEKKTDEGGPEKQLNFCFSLKMFFLIISRRNFPFRQWLTFSSLQQFQPNLLQNLAFLARSGDKMSLFVYLC